MARRKKSGVEGALAALADAWGNAEEVSFGDVPDGVYQVRINGPQGDKPGTHINNSKNSGRLQLSWDCTIMNGDHANRRVFDHHSLEEESLGYMRGTLSKLGHEWPDSPEEFAGVVEDLQGTFAEVRVKTKGDYQNVYFNRALDEDEVEDETEGGEDAELEEEDGSWAIGDRVVVDFDGEPYAGEINGIDGDTVSVAFDNGDEEDVSIDELEAEGDEDAEDEDPEEEGDDDGEEDEDDAEGDDDAAVSVSFDDDSISAASIKKIKALAKEYEFDIDGYESMTDLLADIAEEVGVEGSFKTAPKLISAIGDAAE